MKNCYLVTGGGSGSGKAIAKLLKQQGEEVMIWGTDEKKLKEAVKEGMANSYNVVDVSDYKNVAEGFRKIQENFTLLGVIHAAGVWTEGNLTELDPEVIKKHINIVTNGTVWVVREAVKTFKEKGGKIVLIAAASAKAGFKDSALNTLAKRSMDGLQEALAREIISEDIKLTTLYPDSIAAEESEAVKKGDAMSYQDIAGVILFTLNLGPSIQVREIILTSRNSSR